MPSWVPNIIGTLGVLFTAAIGVSVQRLLVVQAFRPDRLLAGEVCVMFTAAIGVSVQRLLVVQAFRPDRLLAGEVCVMFTAAIGVSVQRLLVVQAFRPDRLLAAAHLFINAVMGSSFMSMAEQELDLAYIIENEVRPHSLGSHIDWGHINRVV